MLVQLPSMRQERCISQSGYPSNSWVSFGFRFNTPKQGTPKTCWCERGMRNGRTPRYTIQLVVSFIRALAVHSFPRSLPMSQRSPADPSAPSLAAAKSVGNEKWSEPVCNSLKETTSWMPCRRVIPTFPMPTAPASEPQSTPG